MNHLHITNLWVNSLMASFNKIGVDTNQITRGLPEFHHGELKQDHPLTLDSVRKLWNQASEISDDPLLGFHVGSNQNFRSSGVLMPICWHSPTVEIALENISNFQNLISENGHYKITKNTTGKHTLCEYVPSVSTTEPNQQQILSVVTGTVLLLNNISGNALRPQNIIVPKNIPAQRLANVIGSHVSHGGDNFVIIYDSADLRQPIQGRDKHLYEINLAYAESMIRAKNQGQTLVNQVKSVIDSELPEACTIDAVATKLGMHQRVLQRHLAHQGSSFRKIKEAVMKERALYLLLNNFTNTNALAEQLGYCEASAFLRAFKSWFGVTPTEFFRQRENLNDNK